MSIKTCLVALGLTVACLFNAYGGELDGVKMPPELALDGKKLLLNGMGTRKVTILKVKVYVAGLYLEKTSESATDILSSKQNKRLEMKFVRDVGVEKIRDAWKEGYEKNCSSQCQALSPQLERFVGFMSDFKSGDILALDFSQSKLAVYVRTEKKGMIEGDDFSRILLSIWLGSNPPNESLKDGLLGKKN